MNWFRFTFNILLLVCIWTPSNVVMSSGRDQQQQEGVGVKELSMIERPRRYEHVENYQQNYPAATAIARQMHCYSCMSKRLQDSWEGLLWQLFRRPEHFTETCDPDHFRRGVVRTRNCTDHCIWLITETQVFGQKIPVYTRGCMSDIINYRQDAVRKLRSGDFCVRRQLSELYNDGDRKFPFNEIVTLCACHSNYCNGAGTRPELLLSLPLLLFLQLLIASGFWRCLLAT